MRSAITSAGRAIRWYIREATGEAKWDAYLDNCRRQGVVPVSRREFERHRADRLEHNPQTRCC